MSKHKKTRHSDEPLHLHLGEDDEEELIEAEEYEDDGGVEVLYPHGRGKAGAPESEDSEAAKVGIEEELPPSKTRIKKQMHELRDLGKELTELGKDQLDQLDLPDNLRTAISEMHRISKFGAQRRQLQYIGKLMREIDPAPIMARLDAWKGRSHQHTAYMHQIERWRDRLMESDAALTELLAEHPRADAQRLRALIRNAHREREQNKPPRSFREIFQHLKEIIRETA